MFHCNGMSVMGSTFIEIRGLLAQLLIHHACLPRSSHGATKGALAHIQAHVASPPWAGTFWCAKLFIPAWTTADLHY